MRWVDSATSASGDKVPTYTQTYVHTHYKGLIYTDREGFSHLERCAVDGGVGLGLFLHLVRGLNHPLRPCFGQHELCVDLGRPLVQSDGKESIASLHPSQHPHYSIRDYV